VSPQQKIVLQASPAADVRTHVWYVDEEFIGSRPPGEKVFLSFRAGRHSVTCLDDRGRSSSVTVTVRMIL
ncbi:MAG: Penicillin-Binding Protein C-terminus Family, partial [Bacteroidetes bacterium]|nr:Penicillin-Binding Protein C-terminus Family [Bacteroidota bacterium]